MASTLAKWGKHHHKQVLLHDGGFPYDLYLRHKLIYIQHGNRLTFLSITVGVVISIVMYYAYIWYIVEPDIIKNGLGAPEKRLVPAIFSSFCLPIGLFLFGWTGNGEIYWIVRYVL